MLNTKPTEQIQQQIIINRRRLSLQRLLLLVLVSILIHGLGLLLFARFERFRHVGEKKADPKPIEFTVVPDESAKTITEDKTSDNQPPAPEPAPVATPTPAPEPQAIPAPTSTVKNQTPVLSGDDTPTPQSQTDPPPEPVTKPSTSDSIATSLAPKTPPISEPEVQPKQPADTNGVSKSASDLLGGDYEKTLASGGDAFFSPEALKYNSVLNPEQLKALKGIDLSQYLAEMEGKVKPNWNPAFRQDERTTVLTFNILKDGQITGLQVSQSSGLDEVDREALDAVQNSVPFAPLPANFPLEDLEITFSFNIHIY
ncbi:MAG: TonB family protein [Hyellaceae cyanobacterium CSU_1_1]|nr:TonB family protein [Hyellaceae cyanobacterium CSU_1_1]